MAIVVTFVALGLLHQAAPYILGSNVGATLVAYSGVGVVVATWASASRLLARATAHSRPPRWLSVCGSVAARVAFWGVLVGCAAWILG